MTLTYTSRLKLAVPDFLTEPWHGEFAQAMESIDRLVYDALLMQGASLWANSTAYLVGDVVISPDNGSLYTCATANTSTASPQTFTAELAAHPTYWTVTAPTLATQAEAEAGVDNTKFMSPLRTKQAFAAQAAQTSLLSPRAGQLTFVSTTQLAFKPFNGNKVKINGVLYVIPTAGIAGLGNTGVRVNGVAGQNLAVNTLYYVYAAVVGGVVTGWYTTNPYRISQTAGNEGVACEFAGGLEHPENTLIGLIRTNASAQFSDQAISRRVRSWYNDPGVSLLSHFTANRGFNSASYIEIHNEAQITFVNWAGETVYVEFNGPVNTGGTAAAIYASIGLDSITAPQDTYVRVDTYGDSHNWPLSVSVPMNPIEGSHFITPLFANVGSASCTLTVDSNNPGDRPTLRGFIPARG